MPEQFRPTLRSTRVDGTFFEIGFDRHGEEALAPGKAQNRLVLSQQFLVVHIDKGPKGFREAYL